MSSNNAMIIDLYGIEKYEIIIYLSALLKELNFKILLVDQSENRALTDCISIPTEFDVKNDKVHYQGIDFTHQIPNDKDLCNYNYIFIDYGFKDMKNTDIEANKHIIVTDKQLHNLNRLQFKDKIRDTYLVFKDIDYNDKTEVLTSLYSENLKVISSYYLFNNELDRKYRYQLQYEKIIKGTSRQMKNLLQDCMIKIFDINKKEYRSAYKKLKKGKI